MQRKRELLENLTPMRVFSPDDVADLIKDIDKNGLKQPLLVNAINNEILDGARRYAALKALEIEAAEVHVSDDVVEIAEILHKMNAKTPPSPARIVDHLKSLRSWLGPGVSRHRANPAWRSAHGDLVRQPVRKIQAYIINEAISPSAMLRLATLIRLAEDGHVRAGEMLAEFEAGTVTAHQALGRIYAEEPKFNGSVSKAGEQNKVLENAITNLRGALGAFRTLRSPVEAADMEKHLISLRRAKVELIGLIKALEKEGK